MGVVSKRHITIIALLALSKLGLGAELSISASVDRSTVGLGQEFLLTVTVQGEDMGSVPRPQLPELPDFNLLSQSQSSSTSVQIINGQIKKQSSVNFSYVLSAKRLGKLTIGPCRLSYQGQEHQSQPIDIEVVKSAQSGSQSITGQSQVQPVPAGASLEGNLFISASPDRRTVYVGEQATVEYTLYSRLRITGMEMAEAPEFSGFWSEKLFDASKVDFQPRTVDGKKYNAMVLKRVALFPMSAGEHQAGKIVLNIGVSQPPRDFFDFFGSERVARIASKPASITALPLPEEGRPKEFSGGVGQFTMTAFLDSARITGSQPATLTVKVSGTGNVRIIEKPNLASVSGLKILEPEIKESIQTAGGIVRGTKTFSFPVLAQADGSYRLPVVKMAFFNPKSKAYYTTAEAGPFECTATGCGQAAPLAEASGLKVLGSDIAHIKPDLTDIKNTFPASPWILLAMYGGSLAMMGGALAYRAHRRRLESDRGYARRSRSGHLVKNRLTRASRHLERGQEREFYAALHQAVLGYVGDRYDIDTGAVTLEQLERRLGDKGIPAETVCQVIKLIEDCEKARFSPSLSESRPEEILARAKEVLSRL
jgi:hypothetical protein